MNKSRYAYFSAILTAAALQAAVVWQDHAAPLAGKLACTFVACLGLAVSREKLAEVEQLVVAACLAGATVLTVVLGHLSASSTTAVVASVALTTFAQVRHLLLVQLTGGAVPATRMEGALEEPPAPPPPLPPGDSQ